MRSSLHTRVVSITLLLSALALVLAGGYLSSAVRDGLFSDRRDQIIDEAARAVANMQSTLETSTTTTIPESQAVVLDLIRDLQTSGGEERGVVLLRSPETTSDLKILEFTSRPELKEIISEELRDEVRESASQRWQSVELPAPLENGSAPTPGIVVGAPLNVPLAGSYELYLFSSLENEQNTLELVHRVMLIAGGALLAALVGISWFSARLVVRPVEDAAAIAVRLADGQLTERMEEKGAHELTQLAHSFNEMAASLQEQITRLEELSHLQRRFVSDVSHELRTPITTIRMASEVLYSARDSFEPAIARSAELLSTQLDRFEELLADLLEISRFDAGAADLDAENADITILVQRAIDLTAPLAETKNVPLRFKSPEYEVTADVDVRRVERIMRNLVGNAIEHSEGQPVDVIVGGSDEAVAIVVRDHGVGMSPDQAAHVFDRFWRADPARARTTGGTGLGLAIALEDANLHGGWLQAWGQSGKGATFRLTLPRRAGKELSSSPLPLAPVMEDTGEQRRADSDPAALPTFLSDFGEEDENS